MNSIKSQRQNKWIDPDFQRRYALVLVGSAITVSLFLLITFWIHSDLILQVLIDAGVVQKNEVFQFIEDQLGSLLISVLSVVLLFCLFLGYVSIQLSHRIAGPMFALKRSLEKISEGKYHEAHLIFREKDEFQEIAKIVNQMAIDLEKRSKNS